MYIEKLKSGSYRISQQMDGKRYRITVDHKPSTIDSYDSIVRNLSDEFYLSDELVQLIHSKKRFYEGLRMFFL